MMRPETSQLPLRFLKPISLKMAYFDAFPAGPPRLALEPDGRRLASVHEAVKKRLFSHPLLHLEVDTGRSTDQLDKDLRKIVDSVRTDFAHVIELNPRGLGDPFLQLAELVGLLTCSSCQRQAARISHKLPIAICRGIDEAERYTVEHAGFCIEPLKRLFRIALEAATEYYKLLAPTTQLHPVFFATSSLAEADAIRNLPSGIHATAAVDIRHAGSVVELSIKPHAFDRKTYQSLFYLLLHECVCHVFQGSVVGGQRSVIGNIDPFGEGWMDWITFLIFGQIIAGTGPFGKRWWAMLSQGRPVEDRGCEIHTYRTDGEREGFNEQLAKGKEGGRRLRDDLSRLLGSRPVADLKAIELSLRINSLALTGNEREEFVTQAYSLFSSPHFGRHQLALDILRSYLRVTSDAGAAAQVVKRCLQEEVS